MVKDSRIRIGITHGDINSIGYEVIIKALMDPRMYELFTPIVYGSSKVASYHKKTLNLPDFNFNLIKKAEFANPKRANIINISEDEIKIEIGKSTDTAGIYSLMSLERAVADLKHNEIDVLVTAPINKKNIQSDNFSFPGHTEYLAQRFETKNVLMLMISNSIRIGVITGHVPLKDVPGLITDELILNKINILNESLIKDFAIRKPRIAILGLNPHSGDNGLIGNEEDKIIVPAIQKANDKGCLVFGPYPADGFFGSSNFQKFDGILAMYHDQGLVPFKTLAFDNGINFTAGLPIVRTSPGHGTAYDIAGMDKASPDSMREALYKAYDICKNRMEHQELTANPLKKTVIQTEEENA